jgi:cytochrome c-type biogenesis protein CcsB
MSKNMQWIVMLGVAMVLLAVVPASAQQRDAAAKYQFIEELDFEHLGKIAVHSDGRVRSYGSFARYMMQFVSGSRVVEGQSPMFTYLDLMLMPRAYEDEPVIYVRNKPMRETIANSFRQGFEARARSMWNASTGGQGSFPELEESLAQVDERMDRFIRTGLISETVLRDGDVTRAIESLRQDLIRTARFVEELDTARVVMDPSVLRRSLRVIPPPGGGFEDPWLNFEDLAASLQGRGGPQLARVDMDLKTAILRNWDDLQNAWRSRDASGVNMAAAALAELLPQVNPELYPGEGSRTGWPWSLDEGAFDWKWITSIFFAGLFVSLGVVSLLMRKHLLAAACMTCGVGWIAFLGGAMTLGQYNPLGLESWYFSSRNMTWVWLLYALALVPLLLSLVFRWRAAHWLGMLTFMVAFGLHTAALLIRWYVSDRWPNSNMFEAVTTAAWFGGVAAILLEVWVWRSPMRSMFALGSAASSMVALMCAYFMPVGLNPNISNMMPVLHDVWLYIHTNVIILAYCLIFMAAVSAVLYLAYRWIGSMMGFGGPQDFARMGGAASLIQTTPDGEIYITKAKTNVGQVLDGTTMILMELSFVLLWAGLVMGAIWADHSWGRPWGWDPKEVFALNTFIVFIVLVHVRLKTKDKGVWTALIALVGAAVMLFNWVAINFVVVGLHSYA